MTKDYRYILCVGTSMDNYLNCALCMCSCHQDAAWVNGGSLKCGSVGDVLLLLKASALLQHDLTRQAYVFVSHEYYKSIYMCVCMSSRFSDTQIQRNGCNPNEKTQLGLTLSFLSLVVIFMLCVSWCVQVGGV
jgi:hypothetical protein